MSWKIDLQQNVAMNYTYPSPSSLSISITTITTMAMIMMMITTTSKHDPEELQKASIMGTAHMRLKELL